MNCRSDNRSPLKPDWCGQSSWPLANFGYQPGVSTLGVEVHQAGAVQLLAGELVVSGQGAAVAVATIGPVALFGGNGPVCVSGVLTLYCYLFQ
jgi:hypothetical protein